MCDEGRHNYEWINKGDRIEAPLVRDSGTAKAVGWKDALTGLLAAAGALDGAKIMAVASPLASNEDLGAFTGLVEALGGGDTVYRSARAESEVVLKGFPTLARRKDLAANVHGADLVGATRVGGDDANGGLDEIAGHSGVILVLGDALADQDESFGSDAALYVYVGTHVSEATGNAHYVLPVTTFAEQEGTFTNLDGRVQRFWPGVEAPGMARPAWFVLGAMVAEMTEGEGARSAADAFAQLAGSVQAFGGMSYDDLGTRGAVVNETVSLAGD
jgi:NADH-quinone oxidoreductase subunit G